MITNDLIARRPKGRSGLAEWYTEVLEARRLEELSVTELATLLEVTPSNIYYWTRRLREVGAGKPDPSAAKKSADVARAGLVRVRVTPRDLHAVDALPPAVLKVRLAGERAIAVPTGFDPDNLRAVIAVLEAC